MVAAIQAATGMAEGRRHALVLVVLCTAARPMALCRAAMGRRGTIRRVHRHPELVVPHSPRTVSARATEEGRHSRAIHSRGGTTEDSRRRVREGPQLKLAVVDRSRLPPLPPLNSSRLATLVCRSLAAVPRAAVLEWWPGRLAIPTESLRLVGHPTCRPAAITDRNSMGPTVVVVEVL